MSNRRDQDPDEEPEPLTLAQRPTPYPMEEAMEEALAPAWMDLEQDKPVRHYTPPPHTADPWDEAAVTQQPATETAKATAGAARTQPETSNRTSQQPEQPASPQPAQAKQQPTQMQPAQVLGGYAPASSPPPAPSAARAVECPPATVTEADGPPPTVAETLATLPQWQARFAVSLMENGGVLGLACTRCNVSRTSVDKARRNNPAFDAACQAAIDHSTDLTEAATWKAGTIGDLRPKYHQGVIVGYDRYRDTKAAELLFKLRGKIDDGSGGKASASVTLVQVTQPAAVPAAVADALARIMGAKAATGRLTQ